MIQEATDRPVLKHADRLMIRRLLVVGFAVQGP